MPRKPRTTAPLAGPKGRGVGDEPSARCRADGQVNINPKFASDPFYRYTMPAVQCKVESSGNGVKTALPNLEAICRALKREPEQVCKYIGFELGTTVSAKHAVYTARGEREREQIQKVLDSFIVSWVVCPCCGDPGTKLRVADSGAAAGSQSTGKKSKGKKAKKGGKRGTATVTVDCGACGHVGTTSPCKRADERFHAYLLNHPPATLLNVVQPSQKKAERQSTGATLGGGLSLGLGTITFDDPSPHEDDEDDWSDWSDADVDESAVEARRQALGTVSRLVMDESIEALTTSQRLERLRTFVKAAVAGSSGSPAALRQRVVAEAQRLECGDKAVMALADALWDVGDHTVLAERIATHQQLFAAFVETNDSAQQYLLHAFEALVTKHTSLLPEANGIMRSLHRFLAVDCGAFDTWHRSHASGGSTAARLRAELDGFAASLSAVYADDDDGVTVDFEMGAGPCALGTLRAQAGAVGAAVGGDDGDDSDAELEQLINEC